MQTTSQFRFDWPNVGKEFSDNRRDKIIEWLEKLDADSASHEGFDHWHPYVAGLKMPFSQGFAVKETIRSFRIPNVSHVAYAGLANPVRRGNLFAIQGHYTNGRVDVVLYDDGNETVTPVACRVWGQ